MLIFDSRGAVRGNQVERSQRGFRQIWRLALDHLNGHDTQTPDVNLATVLLAGNHFGRHPVWRADHGVSLVVRVVDLRAEAKIGCSRVSLGARRRTRGGNLLSLMLPSIDKRMLSDLISR